MKRAFAYLLIFVTISVLFGQDLSSQIDDIDEKYNTKIKENTNNAIIDIFAKITGEEVEITEIEEEK